MTTLVFVRRFLADYARNPVNLLLLAVVPVVFVVVVAGAMADAAKSGDITGPSIKAAMEKMKDHVPADLQGVCIPSTWTPEDHRGTTKVFIYQASAKGGKQAIAKVGEADIPRKAEWLGW